MDSVESDAPREALQSVFHLRETYRDGERLLFYGEALVPQEALIEEVWPAFREAGYEAHLTTTRSGHEDVVVAEPVSNGPEGVPWKNLGLFVATVLSTLFVGSVTWYYVPLAQIQQNPLAVLQAWPFTVAVLGVLSAHELGHYVLGRYHGVDVSLPYLIPFIFPFGTLGAIIRMRGQMPDRRTLFDIGVAGPLAGLAATVVVTAVGLSLNPLTVPPRVLEQSGEVIVFNNPPLLDLIATAIGQPTSYTDPAKTVHPVIIGGWVGMFFTVLNLLPVGQLDGGHMLRAMLGERQETVAAVVPLALFGLAGYLHYGRGLGLNESVGLWAFWGLFATFIAYNGPADPIDETPLDRRRQLVGVVTFALGALCFLLVPIQIIGV
ncbi:site-2 protease family protein [Salinigranum halophilum]|jgi:membrane-associated protease RseP (regulator of RpoE activity)|uniref:site-2 protease family protein n=1 Tax=Salinigranum halophilum TaxID=2565931 RepID=UPI00115CDE7C|nr:site-2 protease family protein [Salinigranum halophilum]